MAALSTERNPERRPDPDALLALAEKGKRGRLLVFIGAAPGVGMTYATLQCAQTLKQEAGDVVVGLVETQKRAETASLTRGPSGPAVRCAQISVMLDDQANGQLTQKVSFALAASPTVTHGGYQAARPNRRGGAQGQVEVVA
jgi:hypothetical protein